MQGTIWVGEFDLQTLWRRRELLTVPPLVILRLHTSSQQRHWSWGFCDRTFVNNTPGMHPPSVVKSRVDIAGVHVSGEGGFWRASNGFNLRSCFVPSILASPDPPYLRIIWCSTDSLAPASGLLQPARTQAHTSVQEQCIQECARTNRDSAFGDSCDDWDVV